MGLVTLAVLAALGGGAARAMPSVQIEHAVARVTVIPEARADVAISVVHPHPSLPVRVTRLGDLTLVDGGLGWRPATCHHRLGGRGAWVLGLGAVSYNAMPQIVIRVPRQAKVGASGPVFGSVGPAAGFELANSGCGDWTVADQSGPLRVRLSGSGDVHAGSAPSADVSVSGSGNVGLGNVPGGLIVSIAGSGDVTAVSVSGPLRARVAGSGDVRVHGGAVSQMEAHVAGSGDVKFGGVAQSLDAHIAGSGDVSAAKVIGAVSRHVAGSGEVTVGR